MPKERLGDGTWINKRVDISLLVNTSSNSLLSQNIIHELKTNYLHSGVPQMGLKGANSLPHFLFLHRRSLKFHILYCKLYHILITPTHLDNIWLFYGTYILKRCLKQSGKSLRHWYLLDWNISIEFKCIHSYKRQTLHAL